MRRFLFALFVLLCFLVSRPGQAAPPRPLVVVAVAPDATELDVPALQAAIGRELDAETVGPDDARAAGARARLDVSIDRTARQLVVSFTGGPEPLTRHVDLPREREAIARAAVLLAGNLARDEAGELTALLRASAAAGATTKAAPAAAAEDGGDPEERASEERLRRTLSGYAAGDRGHRMIGSLSLVGASVAALGSGFLLQRGGNEDFGEAIVEVAVPLAAVGIYWLAVPSPFEKMSTDYEARIAAGGSTPSLREEMERRWKREADNARSWRAGTGTGLIALGVMGGALSTFIRLNDPRMPSTPIADGTGIGLAAAAVAGGIVLIASESNVESRLHAYERDIGHPLDAEVVGVGLAPAPGGAVIGLGGRF
jgi:hypothetical protein